MARQQLVTQGRRLHGVMVAAAIQGSKFWEERWDTW